MSQHDDDVRALHDTLVGLPFLDRVAALAVSLIECDPRAPFAVAVLICAAKIMAKQLPIEQQTAVAWHLAAAIEELETRWN